MATAVSKRSTRSKYQDQSINITPVRNLRPRKTSIIENPQKVNTITKSKQLHIAAENVLTKKNTLNKKDKHGSPIQQSKTTEPSKTTKLKKSDKNEKKMQKKKVSGVISNTLKKNKHKKFIKKEEASSSSASLHQTSLEESFSRQALLKRLRPRQNKKDYLESSKYQDIIPMNSIVALERLNLADIKKAPIYGTVETFEKSVINKSDVYDFQYDINDTKEKRIRKKKKRDNKKTKGKTITVRKKAIVQPKKIENEIPKSHDPGTEPLEIIQSNPVISKVTPIVVESIKKDIPEKAGTSMINPYNQTAEEITSVDKISVEQIKNDKVKPRIISIENADNIIISKMPSTVNDIHPFRPTNIFNKEAPLQYRNTLNCSQLTKLSPITKILDTFDPGSPWRPPILPMFSYAKHFVQSTPNMDKINANHEKHIIHVKNDSHNSGISDIKLKNVESMIQNISDKSSHVKKSSNLHRKFGTEITNFEHPSSSSTSLNSIIEVTSEKSMLETIMRPAPSTQLVTTALKSSNCASYDNAINKENAAPNYQTPKLLKKKKLKKRHVPNLSPVKLSRINSNIQNENTDPQPGPSGIKSLNISNEQKILGESNISNYLTIMDMPENTRLTTKHDVFDDAHSTPVDNNITKKIIKHTTELQNNFGFCENETDFDISPIENELSDNSIKVNVQTAPIKKTAGKPARLPFGEIKDCLIQTKIEDHIGRKPTKDEKITELNEPPITQKSNYTVNVISFSDTFDIFSESEKVSNHENEVPLFIDLEPSYFSKPPHHSYKRKRVARFAFSEDNEEEEQIAKVNTKKKRITKLEKENKKRLDEWVKNVNSTFEEIDKFDLLVE